MKYLPNSVAGVSFALIFGLLLGSSHSMAFDAGAEATIDYRKGVMSALGGHSAAVAAIVVDGADFTEQLAGHAHALVHLTRDMPALFPEGSDFGETAALPAVWETPEDFAQKAEANHAAAVALLEAIESGQGANLGPLFRDVGQSCRSCHQGYRQRN